jgi:ubiquinone/menaquinone biosynthesis C-methylase UbiE
MQTMNEFDAKARTWGADPEKVDRAKKVADLIVGRVPTLAAARVLEVGAGTGLLGFALRDKVQHLTLADSSEEMLATGQWNHPARTRRRPPPCDGSTGWE